MNEIEIKLEILRDLSRSPVASMDDQEFIRKELLKLYREMGSKKPGTLPV